jgi:two-component system, sensor histidine kinase
MPPAVAAILEVTKDDRAMKFLQTALRGSSRSVMTRSIGTAVASGPMRSKFGVFSVARELGFLAALGLNGHQRIEQARPRSRHAVCFRRESLMPKRNTVRVLLLEPDAAAATLFVEALSLRAADFDVQHVRTLAQGLAVLEEESGDVALVELNLEDAQGLATLMALRQRHPALPIVIMSTIADEDLAITAIQQGAQDYLIKELVHYSLISRSIRYALERKRMEVELQAAKAIALAASAAKSEFLAHMSQNIRNPLTAIVNYAEVLLEPDAPLEERHAAIDTIRRNGLHLLEVVNDILDISKIESRAFDVERVACSPTQIVAEALDMFQVRARAKGLDLSVHWRPGIPVTIVSDPLRLKQILVNLLSNAVKFTEHGHIRVDLEPLTNEMTGREPALQISVTDTGIGISPAQQEKLFVASQQSEAWTARQFGGTGLGLAISRELANKLGGDLSLESTLGVGSRFTVRVSIGSAHWSAALAAPSQTMPAEPLRTGTIAGKLLLADDGPGNRRMIATLLGTAGAQVDVVENGQQAIESALAAHRAGQPYDVILMDMVMPEKDGFTATRQLREAGYTGPIVALTANHGLGARQECLAAGCDDFATKPIDRETLIGVVRHWLPVEQEC